VRQRHAGISQRGGCCSYRLVTLRGPRHVRHGEIKIEQGYLIATMASAAAGRYRAIWARKTGLAGRSCDEGIERGATYALATIRLAGERSLIRKHQPRWISPARHAHAFPALRRLCQGLPNLAALVVVSDIPQCLRQESVGPVLACYSRPLRPTRSNASLCNTAENFTRGTAGEGGGGREGFFARRLFHVPAVC